MPLYKYEAMNQMGDVITGRIGASNESELESKLENLKLELLSSKPVNSHFKFGGGITTQDLITMCIQIHQLDESGIELIDCIAEIKDGTDNQYMRDMMSDIYDNMTKGKMLSEAMAAYPDTFNGLFVNLIGVGEKTGNLGEIFHDLSSHLQWAEATSKKIKQAMFYPIFLLFLMMGVIGVMMLQVVPKLSSFLTSQGFKMPGYTRALILTADFFKDYYYLIVLGMVGLYFIISVSCRLSADFVHRLDTYVLKIPVIGETIRKINIARFCRFFAIAYKSGIPILEAMEIANKTVGNSKIKSSITFAGQIVSDGGGLAKAFTSTGQFPAMAVRMIKLGETSGKIIGTLEHLNNFYDSEVADSIDLMLGLIKPLLMLGLGGLMSWIAVAMFGPLYGSIANMNI